MRAVAAPARVARHRVPSRRASPRRGRALPPGADAIAPDAALEAGLIVLAARAVALSLGKAKQGSDLERARAECARRGIDVSDLYRATDAGEQRWFLVGGWRVPRAGDAIYGDGRTSQELRGRLRYDDCRKKADEVGVDYRDIDELRALYPTSTKKSLELRRRLQMAGHEPEWWS